MKKLDPLVAPTMVRVREWRRLERALTKACEAGNSRRTFKLASRMNALQISPRELEAEHNNALRRQLDAAKPTFFNRTFIRPIARKILIGDRLRFAL